MAAGLVDERCRIIARSELPTLSKRGPMAVIDDLAALVEMVLKMGNLAPSDIQSLGVACPGTADIDTGIILFSNNLEWYDVPLKELLEQKCAIPVKVENDANCAALGEMLAGSAKGASSVVLLTLGTGVGGGIIIDGKIVTGFNHAGGEVGHTVIQAGGPLCTCGRRGCLECFASATGLKRIAREKILKYPQGALEKLDLEDRLNGFEIFSLSDQGESDALEATEEYLFYLGEGITNFVNIFQPEKVLLGGGIAGRGEALLEPLRKSLEANVFCKKVKLPELSLCSLGSDAGIIGAAFL